MVESQLLEAAANVVLQSISVWEDLHLYAMTYSIEYNAFWGLLDENLKSTVCRYRNQNREERRVPYTMSFVGYYKRILLHENYTRIRDLHWKKQLKIIAADSNFRSMMTQLTHELRSGHNREYRYLERSTAIAEGNLRISTHVVCNNATALYYYVS